MAIRKPYQIRAEHPRLETEHLGKRKGEWIVGDCESLGQARECIREYRRLYPTLALRIYDLTVIREPKLTA